MKTIRALAIATFALMLAFAMLSGSARATYPNITSGLLDAWDMSTLTSGKAKDFGPNAYHLTINGPTSTTTSLCNGGGAYSFDGVNDEMTYTIDPLAGASSFTIAAHVSRTSLSGTAYAITFGSNTKAVVYGFTANTYQIFDGSFYANIAITNTARHWIVWTHTGSTLKSYLDGVEKSSTSNSGIAWATGTFKIGNSITSLDPFGGVFDEVYLYSTALSATDVSNIAPGCATPPAVSTVAASDILCDRGSLNGNLTSKGTSNPVDVGFQYGKNPTLAGATNATVSANASVGPFNFTATELDESTFYYFRAWANGTDGYTTGSILYFNTTACIPISVCISDLSSVNLSVFIILSIAGVLLGILGFATDNFIPLIISGIIAFLASFQSYILTCSIAVSLVLVSFGLLLLVLPVSKLLEKG